MYSSAGLQCVAWQRVFFFFRTGGGGFLPWRPVEDRTPSVRAAISRKFFHEEWPEFLASTASHPHTGKLRQSLFTGNTVPKVFFFLFLGPNADNPHLACTVVE